MPRRFRPTLCFTLLACGACWGGLPAAAHAHPLRGLVESERAATPRLRTGTGRAVGAGAFGRTALTPLDVAWAGQQGERSALDCEHAVHDIRLDPASGATDASLELRFRAAGGDLPSVGIAIDQGLDLTDAVTATGRAVTVTSTIEAPARLVTLAFDPPLADGDESVVEVHYAGTVGCAASPATGRAACSRGADFSYFGHPSIFPFLFDPLAPDSVAFDGLTRDITLRVPTAVGVVVSGENVSDSVTPDGGQRISVWSIGQPLPRSSAIYALVGSLGRLAVPGRGVPATLVFPAPQTAVDDQLIAWSAPVLDFVESATGSRLPFERSLSLVRFPQSLGDRGTATFGMTLLSDSYSHGGDVMFEETWAHENAHLFWGVVVPEADPAAGRLMSEGLATLTELDYTFARHFSGEDRDRYLARRFLPIGLDLRAVALDLPPVVLGPGQMLPANFPNELYTAWAYYKSAAVLDHLRATVGDEPFAAGLRAYVERCRYVGCGPDVLREVLEAQTGTSLATFFQRWVMGSERPRVRIGWERTANGASVELTKDDDRPLTLELWISLEDGTTLKRRVDFSPKSKELTIDTPSPVLRVEGNPRHDLMVDVRSAVDGDLDFDGETDGLDVLRCARQVGRTYAPEDAVGLWDLAEAFDPRCDVDGDFTIDDTDLARVTASFGKLRASR